MVDMTMQDVREETGKWASPEAWSGLPIVYYPRGLPDSRGHMMGYVVAFNGRKAVLSLPGSTVPIRESVPHVSYPALRLNADHREFGSWDYTEEWKRQQAETKEIQRRLSAIEDRLGLNDDELDLSGTTGAQCVREILASQHNRPMRAKELAEVAFRCGYKPQENSTVDTITASFKQVLQGDEFTHVAAGRFQRKE